MKNLLAKRVKKNNKGFTLVELIIVIAIIAILVAVLAPNYVKYVEKSRWSADQNTSSELLSEVKTAIVTAQEDSATGVGSFIIKMDKNGTAFEGTKETNIETALDNADKDWQKGVVKHTKDQKIKIKDKSGASSEKTVAAGADYYVVYDSASDKVAGGWGANAKDATEIDVTPSGAPKAS
ncbi:MAG: prepilin-type N-terminal cleavage/methylation domain-containing protein [Lachnospiraceae bacterium]|nr:prepilin-type N-terminal cleavage/methylation domain-containing protein [Lachnospiraceae bacterium]